MKRAYVSPVIQSIDHLSFETVCAGSGTIVCPNNRTSIDAASLQCQLCVGERYPWHTIFHSTGGNDQAGRIEAVHAAVDQIGYCPGGLTVYA